MSETSLIQKAFDDYNNTVPEAFFLEFDDAEEGFIDEIGEHPKYVACNSTGELVFSFSTLEELQERLEFECLEIQYLFDTLKR
jgi:hypothetical protein